MKAKHKTIKSHKDLYDSIYNEIKESINFDKKKESRYFLFKGAFYLSLLLFSYISLYFLLQILFYMLWTLFY